MRQHNEHDIVDLISIYLEILKSIFVFVPETTDFYVYIFEKPNVNLSNEDVTKDGIHMIIGLKMSSVLQLYLREKVLKVFETNPNDIDFINDLPLKDTCTWNTVLDEGISKGCVNWQLYGSKKPANQAYKLTGVYHITMDDADNEFCSSSLDVSEYENSFENFCKLSIRYRDHPEYKLQPGMEGVLQERSGKNKQAKRGVVFLSLCLVEISK